MSKSILVIDTPNCCGECPMSGTGVCGKWNRKDTRSFPKDCPLVPIPEKKATAGKPEEHDRLCMNSGYNSCIDEILKEREES